MAEEKLEQEKTQLTIVKDGVEESKEVKKPTPEEVEQYKNDFTEAQKKFEETKWEISEKGKFGTNDVAIYLFDFMKKYGFWSKTGWMGILKMNEELRKAMNLADDNTGLCLGYQALEFCGYLLANPGGIGFESALEFDQQADKYAKIATVVGTKIEEARKQLKEVQYLQEKWAAGEQGFYLADLEASKEEQKTANIETVEVDLSKPE